MVGHFTEHPLYRDDMELAKITTALIDAGRTIFQIYQQPYGESDHAAWLLSITDPELKAKRVLSLGCGVGGMEGIWKLLRPEMEFELVNISQAQLDRAICDGRKVCANAETYKSDSGPFDLVVVCYMLGHVNLAQTLTSAIRNLAPWGRMLVYDVFEGTQNFKETLHYQTPSFKELEVFGAWHDLRFRAVIQDRAQIPLSKFFRENFAWVGLETRPGLFVFQRE